MPELKYLNALDYAVIILYLLLVSGVGIYMSRFNKGTGDYFKAGGRLPWTISAFSLFLSGFSAYMFVAASGFVYKHGLVSVLMFTSAFGAYWLGFFVFGKLWKRARLDSPMELLTRRFSQSTTYFYSIITIVPNILLLAALFYTLCIFITAALGLSEYELNIGIASLSGFDLTLICIGSVVVLYTVLGGLWAVAVTDTVQFIILFLMTIIVVPMTYLYLGDGSLQDGVAELRRIAPSGYLDFDVNTIGWLFLISFWVMNLMGYNANWHVGQRYYSVPDERDTKKIAATCAVLSLVGPLLWILPVLGARVLFPDLGILWPELKDPTEASFVSLCLLLLPHGFLGIIVSAMLAASMSSADSTFNWLGAVVTRDVFVPVWKYRHQGQEPDDKLQLRVGKMTVLIVGILAIFISLNMKSYGGAFDIYLKIYSITVPCMFVPVLAGMVFRRTPWWSAMAASGISIVATLLLDLIVNLGAGQPVQGFAALFEDVKLSLGGINFGKYEINVIAGGGISLLVFLLSSRWPDRSDADKQRLKKFDLDLNTPVGPDPRQYDLKSLRSYQIVAVISGFIGFLLLGLALATSATGGFSVNIIAGSGALLFALVFWFLSKKFTVPGES